MVYEAENVGMSLSPKARSIADIIEIFNGLDFPAKLDLPTELMRIAISFADY